MPSRDQAVKRRFKRFPEMARDSAKYPLKHPARAASRVGWIAQAGVFGYLGYKGVEVSINTGRTIDQTVEDAYRTVQSAKDTVAQLARIGNDIALKFGVGYRPSQSEFQELGICMTNDLQQELLNGSSSHSAEKLEAQKESIGKYLTEIGKFEQSATDFQASLADLKHSARSTIAAIGKPSESFFDKIPGIGTLQRFKSKSIDLTGNPPGETYKQNFDDLEDLYMHLDKIEDISRVALGQVMEEYKAQIGNPRVDAYLARQEFLDRSLSILESYKSATELRKSLNELEMDTNTASEQAQFTHSLQGIVAKSQAVNTAMRDMGFDTAQGFEFAIYALPILTASAFAFTYSQIRKYEGKVFNGARSIVNSVRNALYATDNTEG